MSGQPDLFVRRRGGGRRLLGAETWEQVMQTKPDGCVCPGPNTVLGNCPAHSATARAAAASSSKKNGGRVWIGWERDDGHWANPEELRDLSRARLIGAVSAQINGLLERDGVSRIELAKRIGKSPAFVTQVLNGERNMTLKTLADLFSGLGYEPALALAAPSVSQQETGERPAVFVVHDEGASYAVELNGHRVASRQNSMCASELAQRIEAALASAPSQQEGGDVEKLLARVHERLGGVGIDLVTFGDGSVEARWKRDYGEDGLSDERRAGAQSLAAALRAVLDYEDEADRLDAEESSDA